MKHHSVYKTPKREGKGEISLFGYNYNLETTKMKTNGLLLS